MDKWEYLRGRMSEDGYVTIGKDFHDLNDLGKKGWELTGIAERYVVFKRRIPESPAPTQAQNTSRQPEVDMGLTF